MPTKTLRELAAASGYSLATVSMALRDDPRVAASTRRLVQELAAREGYRPEPLVRDLMARVRHGDGTRHDIGIAYVLPWETRAAHDTHPAFRAFRDGARARAAEGGYRMEEMLLHETGRHGGILRARAFAGVVVAPRAEIDVRLAAFSLDFCAGATIGYSVRVPRLSRAVPDHGDAVDRGLAVLRERGHRRIGLVVGEIINRRVCGRWLGAFAAAHAGDLAGHTVPPLLLPGAGEARAFDDWWGRHRPDAILTIEWELVRARLHALGADVPENVSLAHLEWRDDIPGGAAGLDQRHPVVGAAAVDLVVGQIVRHERGEPAMIRTLLIESRWADGPTVIRRHTA